MVAVFLLAGILDGIVSGVVLTRVGFAKRAHGRPKLGRSIVVGLVLIVPLLLSFAGIVPRSSTGSLLGQFPSRMSTTIVLARERFPVGQLL
jgi:hypothetical protein